jgi:subtilisin-like proprotein convertase family protein
MKKLLFLLFALPTSLFSQTFTGTGGAINDVATNDFMLNVSGLNPANIDTATFGLEQICINLTHTYDGDLDIRIIAPDGTNIPLSTGNGGGGQDYTNTCFNTTAASSITAGSAPYTGTFRPQGQIGRINNGQTGNGTWTLRVVDMAAQDFGNLISWSVTFGNNPASYIPFSSSNMPIVIINTNNQQIPTSGKITADMGLIYNGPNIRNYLTDPRNEYNGKIGIEIRGNYSAGLPQKPYNIELRDVNGFSIDSALLDMPAENDWYLLANFNDKSFARNLFSMETFRSMGHWAPRARLVEVELNGEYQGVYLLCESIKRDANRVDIAKLDITETTWPDISGGYMMKIDYWDNTNSWLLNYNPIDHPNLDVHMVYVYPKPDVIVPQQKTYLQTFINDYETALYSSNFADTANGYRKYASTRSFIDYFLVNEMARNVDGFKKSRYFYKEKDKANGTIGKMKAGPVWDFDWAWKDIWDCSYFQQTDGSGWSHLINDCGPDVNSPGWYVRMLQDSTFADAVQCRWTELRGTILDTTAIWHFIDSIATYSNEAQQRHYDYWGHMGQASGTPEVNPPAQSYAEEIDNLKAWIRRRLVWLDANMPGTLAGCNIASVDASIPSNYNLIIYPSPFTSHLSIDLDLPQAEMVEISLTDALGRTCGSVQQRCAGGRQTVMLMPESELAAGVYLVRVRIGDAEEVRRVVKE